MTSREFRSRYLRRCGRPSGERHLRLLDLVCLLDRYADESDRAEVFLPIAHAARVLRVGQDALIVDLGHLGGVLGCLSWFTLVSGGLRVAVISTGRHMVDADNDLFDAAHAALVRLDLVSGFPADRLPNLKRAAAREAAA